ncbi:hypothetical protein H8959_019926 [Pygathrix nigripes]
MSTQDGEEPPPAEAAHPLQKVGLPAGPQLVPLVKQDGSRYVPSGFPSLPGACSSVSSCPSLKATSTSSFWDMNRLLHVSDME